MKTKFCLEKISWKDFKPNPVIGVDEVGRGCLAGPVYAAAVILKSDYGTESFTDSKLLSESRREETAALIIENHLVGIGFATQQEIDQINILQASFLAMKRALQNLKIKNGHVLVDGSFKIPNLPHFQQTALVKGDLRCAPISAASIVAKVTRDQVMHEYSKAYPIYGFEKHKGYSTEFHKKIIADQGPCPLHRKSFSGVKEYLEISS